MHGHAGYGRSAAGRGKGAIAAYLEDNCVYGLDGALIANVASDTQPANSAAQAASYALLIVRARLTLLLATPLLIVAQLVVLLLAATLLATPLLIVALLVVLLLAATLLITPLLVVPLPVALSSTPSPTTPPSSMNVRYFFTRTSPVLR